MKKDLLQVAVENTFPSLKDRRAGTMAMWMQSMYATLDLADPAKTIPTRGPQ